MTQKALWQHVKDLVECDKKITSIVADIEHAQKNIKMDQETIAKLEQAIVEKTQAFFNVKKQLELEDLEIKSLQEQEQRKRESLDNVKDQKAYKALDREVEYLNVKRSNMQEELTQEWLAHDKQHSAFNETKKASEEKIKLLIQDRAIKQEHIADVEKKHVAAMQERAAILPHIPAEWLTKYERMRSTVPDPVVPVQDSHCSACFYAILYQDLVRLKQSNVLLCRNCYRFLFYPQEPQIPSNDSY